MEAEVRPHPLSDSDTTTTPQAQSHAPPSAPLPSQAANIQTNSTSISTNPTEEALYTSFSAYTFDTDAEFQTGLSSILGHQGTQATQTELDNNKDLVLQAQCFYFARKFNTPPINPTTYKTWLASKSTNPTTDIIPDHNNAAIHAEAPASNTTTAPTSANTTAPVISPPTQPPPYPTSFAAIVDLITQNKPIPGIEDIPTTVLDHGSSKRDTATRRRKPWEKDQPELEVSSQPQDQPDNNTAEEILPVAQSTAAQADPSPQGSEPSKNVTGVQGEEEQILDVFNRNRRTGEGVMHILRPDAVPNSGLVAKD